MIEVLYNALAQQAERLAHPAWRARRASKASSTWTRSSTSTSHPLAARRAPIRAPIPACSTRSASLFAELPESKIRGYKPGRFSFNVHGGRCEACQGQGQLRIEMQFLPDVYVPCDVCHGARFNRETLQVRFKGLQHRRCARPDRGPRPGSSSRFPVHDQPAADAAGSGSGLHPHRAAGAHPLRRRSAAGQAGTELSKRATGRTLYVLDEPSVGLHAADVHKLIEVLQRLVDAGNIVLIIEHNLDIIKVADYMIDLGPEGGDRGGLLVAEGTPEEVCAWDESLHRSVLATVYL